jgi:hypothetical protein
LCSVSEEFLKERRLYDTTKIGAISFFVSVLSFVTENDRTAEEIYGLYKDDLLTRPFTRIVGTSVRANEIEDVLLYLAREGYVKKSLTNFISEPLDHEIAIFRLNKKVSNAILAKK